MSQKSRPIAYNDRFNRDRNFNFFKTKPGVHRVVKTSNSFHRAADVSHLWSEKIGIVWLEMEMGDGNIRILIKRGELSNIITMNKNGKNIPKLNKIY